MLLLLPLTPPGGGENGDGGGVTKPNVDGTGKSTSASFASPGTLAISGSAITGLRLSDWDTVEPELTRPVNEGSSMSSTNISVWVVEVGLIDVVRDSVGVIFSSSLEAGGAAASAGWLLKEEPLPSLELDLDRLPERVDPR